MAFFGHAQRRSGKEERGNNGEREEIEKQLLFRLRPSLSSPSIGIFSGKPLYIKAGFRFCLCPSVAAGLVSPYPPGAGPMSPGGRAGEKTS